MSFKGLYNERREALLVKLEEVSFLPENWDTYGAKPIDSDVIEKTKEVILNLDTTKLWNMVPGSDGSIQLECHEDGFSIEINVSRSTTSV